MSINKVLKCFVFILFLTLLSSFCLAANSFSDEWGEYQNSPENLGHTGLEITDLSGNWNETDIVSSVTDGADFQPLGIDADNDGTIELIGSSGNYLKIWSYSTAAGLHLEDDKNMEAAQTVQMSAIDGFDADAYIEFIAVFGKTNVSVFEWNGTHINIEQSALVSNSGNATTGIKCVNVSAEMLCYFGTDAGDIIEFNTSDGTALNYTVHPYDNFTFDTGNQVTPAIDDIDRDGNDEIIFAYAGNKTNHSQYAAATDRDGIFVFDTKTKTSDSNFNNGGILDALCSLTGISCGTTAYTRIAGVITYNTDDAGDKEIIVTFYSHTTGNNGDTYIAVLNSDGTVKWFDTTYDNQIATKYAWTTPPVIRKAETDARTQICLMTNINGTPANWCKEQTICYRASTEEKVFLNVTPTSIPICSNDDDQYVYSYKSRPIISANIDNLNMHELISGKVIYNIGELANYNVSSIINITNIRDDVRAYPIAVDMNNDGVLEVCAMREGRTYCAFSSYTNQPPVINEDKTFLPNFITPVCIYTTVIFEANQITHYTNDYYQDTERLSSNCGINATILNGTFDATNPIFNCYFNKLGTFNFRIYLQDNVNTDDYSQYREFTYYVVNSTYPDCNLPVPLGIDELAAPAADDVTSEEDIAEGIAYLTYQSPFIKLLLTLSFSLMLVFGLAKYRGLRNPMIYIFSIFMLWILLAAIGMLSWVYVLIYGMTCFGLAAVMFALGRGGNE